MNFQVKEHGNIAEVVIEGNILQENVDLLKNRFFELIEEGTVNIILNMAQSNYVSSLCLAVIVDVKNRLIQEKGDLRLCKVNRLIHNLLEITNLVKMIEVYDTIDDAIASFKQ